MEKERVYISGLSGAGCGCMIESVTISICNRMRLSRIKDKFSRVFSKFLQNCPSRAATRAICENFENTSEIYP